MTSSDLTPEQAHKLMEAVGRQLRYVTRLCQRMNRCRFPGNDPLYLAGLKAQDALQQLCMAAHYAGCKSGVGKPSPAPTHIIRRIDTYVR